MLKEKKSKTKSQKSIGSTNSPKSPKSSKSNRSTKSEKIANAVTIAETPKKTASPKTSKTNAKNSETDLMVLMPPESEKSRLEKRKSRERTRERDNVLRKRSSTLKAKRLLSTSSSSNKTKNYDMRRSKSELPTRVKSQEGPITINTSSSLYHNDCVTDEAIDDAIHKERLRKQAVAEKIFDPKDLANRGKTPPLVNMNSTTSHPRRDKKNRDGKGKHPDEDYTVEINSDGEKQVINVDGKNSPIYVKDEGGNQIELLLDFDEPNEKASVSSGKKQPKTNTSIHKKNICIHIHANGDESEVIIEPEDLQMLLKWKADKHKHGSSPMFSTNPTEQAILTDWESSRVQLKQSQTGMKKKIQHRTSQTDYSSDGNKSASLRDADTSSHLSSKSSNKSIPNEYANESEIPYADMAFNADGTFHADSSMPAGHNYQQMPNNFCGCQNNTNSCPPQNGANQNSWLKCSPNCCWYSYTNCTHWNPMGCNRNMNNTNNMNNMQAMNLNGNYQ